jgi:glycosyltransferase involved in cell wall biosynthesis
MTGAPDDGAAAAESDARPVLFVTNHAPPFRVPAFAALHESCGVVFALIGGRVRHGGGGTAGPELPFPAIFPPERAVARLAASGRFRAVVAGLSGRVALPAAYLGARTVRVPFVLWATIWRHPRTPAHALSYLPLRHIYRHADAVATYGPHVSAYVRAKGARTVVEAPQAADAAFWEAPAEPARRAPFQALFAGRLAAEKGVDVLLAAWRRAALPDAALVLAGDGPLAPAGDALAVGPQTPAELRNSYAGSDVVVVPSVPTRDFLEPWGLVVNEAFHQGVPVIATDAVGAAAGGLVQHERTGLVVPAGDPAALAAALRRLHSDPALRARLGAAGRRAVSVYTPRAWAAGMARALTEAGASGC